jgi:hypothetical protein
VGAAEHLERPLPRILVKVGPVGRDRQIEPVLGARIHHERELGLTLRRRCVDRPDGLD